MVEHCRYQIKVGSKILRFQFMPIGFLPQSLFHRLKSLSCRDLSGKWWSQKRTGGWAVSKAALTQHPVEKQTGGGGPSGA